MLISFSVENFRSFKEEATLSMVAGNGKELRDSHVFTPKMKNKVKPIDLLRSAVIYGPNASGKSNLFKAFATMSRIVRNSSKVFETLPVIPFKLSEKTENSPSVFEVVMMIGGVRYQYGFSATEERIHDEWLLAFPKGKTQTWFERTYNKKTKKYKYPKCNALKGQKKVWETATKPTALFLSTAVQLNSTQLQSIYDWLISNTLFIDADGISPQVSLNFYNKDKDKKIINFLKAADFAIEDMEVKEENFSQKHLPEGTPEPIAAFIASKMEGKKHFSATTIHKTDKGKPVNMDLDMESDGTQRMLALFAPFSIIIKAGAILVVDELNQRLHPYLMRYLIELFNNPKTNPNNAQLIFTSHAVSLLKNDIFRRDQIWFCERGKDQSSTLFPLSDFKPRKEHEDFEGYYMGGRYGALPFIGDFSESITKDTKK